MLRKLLHGPRRRITTALLALSMVLGTTTAIITVTSAGAARADSATEIADAVSWAESQTGSTTWDGFCLLFVYDAYLDGTSVNIGTADTAYDYWNNHASAQVTDGSTPPAGALVFWGPDPWTTAGHVALSTGNGNVISTKERNYTGVHQFAIADRNNAGYAQYYLGWMMPPGISAPSGGSGTSTSVASLPNGTYIQASDNNHNVYVMAGGAPMLVYAWANVGGSHSISYTYPQAQITQQGLMYPRDGTVVRDAVSGALFVVAGGFPFGVTATTAVPSSYSDPNVYVNVDANAITGGLRSQPADGTAIRDFGNGRLYVISGGAPVYVHDPTMVPYTTWINIDNWDLSNELKSYPADGSVVVDYHTSRVYVVAGHAALAVNSLNNIPPVGGMAFVDDWAVQNQLRRYPIDGTVLQDYASGDLEVVAGGARMHISHLNDVPYQSWVSIDENAASGQFLQYPEDGTVIQDYVHKTMYVVVGGSPLYITTPNSVPPGDMTNYVAIDPNSFSQLLGYPMNGSFVVGYVSGKVYQIQNQQAVYIGNSSLITSTPIPVDDWAITNELHGN